MTSNLDNIYVYGTIVNKNDEIPNAIVLSHSIKNNGTMYKIIVKINDSVNKTLLMNYFDTLIYSEKDFEKYEKVLLIDINSLVNKNLDYLFNIDDITTKQINENIIRYEQKPYSYEGPLSIQDIVKNEKYILWYRYYRDIINNNFDLLNNNILKDVNEILKMFTSNLSLTINEKNKKNKENNNKENKNKDNKYSNLKTLYDNKIINNYEYYYTNVSKEYNDTSINFYTENISLSDFIILINSTLKKKYNEKNYKNIKDFIKECEDKETVIDLYLKYSPAMLIILINNDTFIDEDIKKNIIYTKNTNMNNYDLKNILFDINQEYVYDERILYLDKTYQDKTYKITLLCFEMKDYINFKDKSNIIICENIDKKIRASGLLLKNYNNKYDFIKNYKNIKNTLIIQTLKKWIYNNFNGEEITNIIIFIMNDKYIIVDNNNYENFIYKIKILNKIKLYFMELIFTNHSSYKKIIKQNKHYTDYNINNCYEIDGLKFLFIN